VSVTVFLSTHVDAYTGGRTKVQAEGGTLAELMADLERQYPGLRFRVIDEQDRIRPHMNFFVAGERVSDLSCPVGPGVEVYILAALSGG
jgi:molybdopterin converting factor small subunit